MPIRKQSSQSFNEPKEGKLPSSIEKDRDTMEASRRNPTTRTIYTGYLGLLLVTACCFASGVVYTIVQWNDHGAIEDAVFVSMLIGATMILMLGLRALYSYIATKGMDFYSFALSTPDPEVALEEHRGLCASVFNSVRMTLVGFVYGLAVGSAPLLLGVWPNDLSLRLLLTVFMFFVNFATGLAFYGLVVFFFRAVRMGQMVKVDLWHIDNPSTGFLLGATRRISVLASVYVCICLSSILFSELPVSGLVIAYSCFSGAIILASLLIPSHPVAQKLRDAKAKTLGEIEIQLNAAFQEAIENMKTSGAKVDLVRFESLLQLREKVEKIHTWPFRVKALTAGASVVFFSSIPVILQLILERVLG